MRVLNFLSDEQICFELCHHAPAFTAQRRAHRLHTEGRRVIKTALLATENQFLLAVLPASHQIDVIRFERETRSAVRFANEQEMREIFNDCEWGLASPFGHLYGVSTVLDASLKATDIIALPGHLHVQSIRMNREDFERLERPSQFQFALPGKDAL